jgi:limonene-1,2-epoxide hydrolase
MDQSPESVVRQFLAAWPNPDADELAQFLSDDAVWVDGPQEIKRGKKEIVEVLVQQLAVSRGSRMEVSTLLADGGTVMVEWHGQWTTNGKPINATVMAVFEVNANGQITQMREAYDLKSVMDQLTAAGFTG